MVDQVELSRVRRAIYRVLRALTIIRAPVDVKPRERVTPGEVPAGY